MNWPKASSAMMGVKVHSDGETGPNPTVSLAPMKNRAVEIVSDTFNTSKLTKDLTKTCTELLTGLKLHTFLKTKLPIILEKLHGENSHLEPDSLVKVQCGHDIASSPGGSASQPHEHFLDPDNHNNNHLIYLKYYSRPSVTWMFQGISTNRLAHMLNGNENRSYNIGMWNCRKGLINKVNLPTTKIVDVKDFLSTNDLQILCLIEQTCME